MNIFKPYPRIFKTCLVLFLLVACNSENLNFAEGGLEGTGTGDKKGSNIGTITDFGSIIVNDILYDTNRANILINGETASFEQLRLGMQVTVNSSQDEEHNIAEQINYQDSLRGPVQFITPSSLRIIGQTILIDEQTKLHGFERIDELQIDDYLRVSGPSSRPNGIQATLLERLPSTSEILLSGAIIHLDAAYQTFFIKDNGTLISYKEVQMLPANLHDGQIVEVIATFRKPILQANRIRLLDIQKPSPGASFIFNGTVTRFAGLDDFEVEYQPVRINTDTRINHGKLEDIALGANVKISGSVNEKNVLIIDTVDVILMPKIRAVFPMRVSGPLENINLQAQQLTVFGVPVQLLSQTLFKDVSGQFKPFGPTDLRLGERITAIGSIHTNGGIAAKTVSYEPFAPAKLRQLQGSATHIDNLNGNWQIFGVTVLTNDDTEFFDSLDSPLKLPPPGSPLIPPLDSATDATTFFTRLNSNVLVYASGEGLGDVLLAKIVVLVQRLDE